MLAYHNKIQKVFILYGMPFVKPRSTRPRFKYITDFAKIFHTEAYKAYDNDLSSEEARYAFPAP